MKETQHTRKQTAKIPCQQYSRSGPGEMGSGKMEETWAKVAHPAPNISNPHNGVMTQSRGEITRWSPAGDKLLRPRANN
jgi:hypothetical protein